MSFSGPFLSLFSRAKIAVAARGGRKVQEAPVRAASPAFRQGWKSGVKAERKRIRAILDLPETNGRYEAALTMALDTDLSAALVQQYLREMPRRRCLAEVMAEVPNPDIGGDWAFDPGQEPSADAVAQRIVGRAREFVISPSKESK